MVLLELIFSKIVFCGAGFSMPGCPKSLHAKAKARRQYEDTASVFDKASKKHI
jgi:hypothetical protein